MRNGLSESEIYVHMRDAAKRLIASDKYQLGHSVIACMPNHLPKPDGGPAYQRDDIAYITDGDPSVVSYRSIIKVALTSRVPDADFVRTPMGGLETYLGIFKARPDIATIVYCSPAAITGMAREDSGSASDSYLAQPMLASVVLQIGPVKTVQFSADDQLKEIGDLVDGYNAFLVQNSGLLLLSRGTPEDAAREVALVERASRSIGSSASPSPLGKVQLDGLEAYRVKNAIPLPGKEGVWRSLQECYALTGL